MLEHFVRASIMSALQGNGVLATCINSELLRIFGMLESYVDPTKNQLVFEAIDDELARRVS
jgi:hypothetical protein